MIEEIVFLKIQGKATANWLIVILQIKLSREIELIEFIRIYRIYMNYPGKLITIKINHQKLLFFIFHGSKIKNNRLDKKWKIDLITGKCDLDLEGTERNNEYRQIQNSFSTGVQNQCHILHAGEPQT